MPWPEPRFWRLALACLLGGCASDAVNLAPPRPDRPWHPRTDASGAILAGEPAISGGAGPSAHVLPGNTRIAGIAPSPGIDREHPYTLPELIDLAESNNPLTRIAWNAAREIALAAGIAKSAYLPRLTAAAVGGHQNSSMTVSNPLGGAGNTSSGEGSISSVSLNWLLYDFGLREAAVEAATQASVVSNIGFTAAHQEVIHAVTLAFYAHTAAEARVKLAEQSLRNTETVEAAAQERLNQGIGTVIELDKAKQMTAQARLSVVQARGATENTQLALLSAVGLSPLSPIRIVDVSDRKLEPGLTDSVEKIIGEALARRPDVLAAYASEKAAQASIDAAEADFYPKLFLSGTGAYTNGSLYLTQIPSIGTQSSIGNFGSSGFGVTVFGGLTLPLYDGGARDAVLHQAHAKAENAQLKLARTRDEAVRQIVQANHTLRTAIATHEAAGAVVGAASTTFDAALASYRSGAGSITDVTLAETQWLQARIAVTEAHSAALSAAATLALATGTLDTASRCNPGAAITGC